MAELHHANDSGKVRVHRNSSKVITPCAGTKRREEAAFQATEDLSKLKQDRIPGHTPSQETLRREGTVEAEL